MAFRSTNPNLLIVEGADDKFAVVGLMEHHVNWPGAKENAPVYIDVGGSAEEILAPSYLSVQLKVPHLKRLGVMLDADDKLEGSFKRIRDVCSGMFPEIPQNPTADGMIVHNSDSQRLGVWIMPDNLSEGSLETFLRYLVHDQTELLWQHCTDAVAFAIAQGAPCRQAHLPKANLYTWLAWQDPPGQSPGRALTQKILDPLSPHAGAFVTWFKKLYDL